MWNNLNSSVWKTAFNKQWVRSVSFCLFLVISLIILNIVIPHLPLTGIQPIIAEKFSKIVLIFILAFISCQILNGLEVAITARYFNETDFNPAARKLKTQIIILKRIALMVIFIVATAAILMLFESVRNLGEGLLTTAGIVGAIGAYSSHESLGKLFTGIQIAFSQPIRVGDTVIIDGESGQVEEIAMSYVVIKLWDLRRLILPIDYFTTKAFQNLTRSSTQLIGTIFLYLDHTCPVDMLREKFFESLNESASWDKKTANLDVTEMKEYCLEVRCLVSADDANKLWNLRCEIREKLIHFVATSYPQYLPKMHYLQLKNATNALPINSEA